MNLDVSAAQGQTAAPVPLTINLMNAMAAQQANTAKTQAESRLNDAQTSGQLTDVQQKQNNMQASILAGLAKLPPEQYESARDKLIPIANQLGSRKFDPNLDQQTVGLIAAGGVPAEAQATLANNLQRAQMMNTLRAQKVEKDPMTGQMMIVDTMTGTSRPISPQENEYYNATGQLPGDNAPAQPQQSGDSGMLFAPTRSGQQAFQNFKSGITPVPPGGGQPLASPQTDFGFDPIGVTPIENKKNMALTQQWQSADQGNRPLFENMQDKIAAMRPNIKALGDDNPGYMGFGGAGSTLGDIGIGTKKFVGTGVTTNAAQELTSQANDLATMATQLQGMKTGNRGSVLQLKTALASKPNTSNTPQVNNDLLDEMEAKVARADADSALYNAYISATGNPTHTLDNRAYQLADALDKEFPILDKNGKLNPDNLAQWKAAIPDALANPKQYLNAKNQAGDHLQKPPQPGQGLADATTRMQSGGQPPAAPPPPPGGIPINTPEAVGAALQDGKISEAQARKLWSSMGLK